MGQIMMMFNQNCDLVLEEIKSAMARIDQDQASRLAEAILKADKVFLAGVGRSLISLQAFSKRLNHLGVKSFCVGDLNEPAATPQDLLIVGSASGESKYPLVIAQKARMLGMRIAHIGSNANSSLKSLTDVFVRIPVNTKLKLEDEMQSKQILTSLFEQCLYIFCDVLALMIIDQKRINIDDLWKNHANLE
jgi:6-phospho-3-hexuloisomerase